MTYVHRYAYVNLECQDNNNNEQTTRSYLTYLNVGLPVKKNSQEM